ncbi:MAG: FmdB family transcriptional regulator [Gammaproteobacteria bacterium HGW-Gammaproteobacteria-8]|nr:MAG: FmdB family transcriptional regulator [Gammaproteobacteria bacterium HGW-Gammaproteobacteria-8]
MPIYEYINSAEPGCDHCRGGFTRLEKLADPPLGTCPACATPVRRVISAPRVVSGKAHMLKESSIEKAGFTQYKKIGKGVYEKTAGKGPGIIKND